MIDLATQKTENAAKLQTVDLELDALDEAETFTVSVVDSATLALLESPLELRVQFLAEQKEIAAFQRERGFS